MNDIRGGRVACYMDDIRLVSEFWRMTAASPDFQAWLRRKNLTSDVYIGLNTLKRDAQSRTKEDVDASLVCHMQF
jgi:hypothetical protein